MLIMNIFPTESTAYDSLKSELYILYPDPPGPGRGLEIGSTDSPRGPRAPPRAARRARRSIQFARFASTFIIDTSHPPDLKVARALKSPHRRTPIPRELGVNVGLKQANPESPGPCRHMPDGGAAYAA